MTEERLHVDTENFCALAKATLDAGHAFRFRANGRSMRPTVHNGDIIKVKEDLYFDAGAVSELKDRLVNFLQENGEITTPQFKDMTGASRKYVIPLIEYFDSKNVTIRIGKRRIKGVKRYYEQGRLGKLMALFDSWGYLELAVNMGNAFNLLGLTEKKSLEVFVSGPALAPKRK